MKSYRKELTIRYPKRRGYVNITPQVEDALRESGIKEGLVLVNSMHITSSVFINDDESREVVVAVTCGKLDFGTWEQIFYGEYDGMRDKRLLIKIIGE